MEAVDVVFAAAGLLDAIGIFVAAATEKGNKLQR